MDTSARPPRPPHHGGTAVMALLMILFLALSAFSALYILFHDQDAQRARALSSGHMLGRLLARHLEPPLVPFALEMELQNAAADDPTFIRLSVMLPQADGSLGVLASTWPSLAGARAGGLAERALASGKPLFTPLAVGGRDASVLLLPVSSSRGDRAGVLEVVTEAARPSGMMAGMYAVAATLLMVLMAVHHLRQQSGLSRELARRRSAEAELRQARDRLEDTVRDRTRELTEANASLEREAAERARMAEEIARSLAEKETLLQEIHHRVKNNLQIVVSLLDMAGRRTDDERAREVFSELSSKVHGISLVHTQLHQSETLDSIDMEDYARKLNAHLVQVFRAAHVRAHFDMRPLRLSMETATPLGMVLNEILTNAYKHAFRGRESGELRVGLSLDGGLARITVADDGPGIPEGFEPERTESLGMRLVNNIVTYQLKGSLRLENRGGTTAVVEFDPSPPRYRERAGRNGGDKAAA